MVFETISLDLKSPIRGALMRYIYLLIWKKKEERKKKKKKRGDDPGLEVS